MAEIEIVYRSSLVCDFYREELCEQCHTSAAFDVGCEYYLPDRSVEPFGNGTCSRAHFRYSRKGWVGKSYEIGEPFESNCDHSLDYIPVVLGGKSYNQCVKVKLNGRVIYNNYDNEEVDEDA